MASQQPNRSVLSRSASAYLVAIGALSLMVIVILSFSQTTISNRWTAIFSNHEKKAEECAEAACQLTFRTAQERINDRKQFYGALKNPTKLFQNWFMHFRIPTFVAEANFDPVSWQGSHPNGMDVGLDLFNNGIYKPLYENGIQATYTYDVSNPANTQSSCTDSGPNHLEAMSNMLESMGGKCTVHIRARIARAFGILARDPQYKVPGINVKLPSLGTDGPVGKILDGIFGSPPPCFEFNALDYLPDKNLVKEFLKQALDDLEIKALTPYSPIPLWIPLGKLLNMLGIGDVLSDGIATALGLENVSLKGIAKLVAQKLGLSDMLTLKIDFGEFTDNIKKHIDNMFPSQLDFLKSSFGFDITVEKQGVLEVRATVTYQPYFPNPGPSIKKTLVMEREFRCADVQPIAPDHTFFVANSAKLYEQGGIENQDNWEGDDKIDWNKGDGNLVCHNLPPLGSIVDTFKGIVSLDLDQLTRKVMLPGLVRVNGTQRMDVKLNFADPGNLLNLFRNEMLALAIGHSSDYPTVGDQCRHITDESGKHDLMPKVERVDLLAGGGPWSGKGWDWPYFRSGWFIPMIENRGRTYFFGNAHLEVPFSLRVEGHLCKQFSHIKMLIWNIWIPGIPPIPPFFPGFPGFFLALPFFQCKTYTEPYGFCRWPPWKKDQDPSELWNPDNYENLPSNIYTPQQYVKKCSYYYEKNADFLADIPNRSKTVNGEQVFVVDGVTFVNDKLRINRELKIMGRGMIVAAGNIHVSASIKKAKGLDEGEDTEGNPTVFSLVARNGAFVNDLGDNEIHACIFADRGIRQTGKIKIHGNLVCNRFDRSKLTNDLEIYYESKHCRTSLLSLIRPIAKWDPTRYYVSLSGKTIRMEFEKRKD